MKKFQRRDFIKTVSIAAVAASSGMVAGCDSKKENKTFAINTGKNYEWKMVTSWPPNFPILGEYAVKIAEWIENASGGRMKIKVYAGGELVPALEVFDAVSFGAAEMGHSASYYWAGKTPAAQFFAGVPFGMNARQMNAWLLFGGGLDLWRELYADFNLFPFPCGNTGGQMGGWFNKEIFSVRDLRGLKIRMPGLGGKVMTRAGADSVLSSGGELYSNFERGVIDAVEWIGPYHDYLMGFQKIAKYYYYPGWHEPGSNLELIVNKNAYEKLPDDLKAIIKAAANAANVYVLAAFDAKNTEYYLKMLYEENISFRKFPEEVMKSLKFFTGDVISKITKEDEMSRKVYESYSSFQKKTGEWFEIAERNWRL